MEGDSLYTLLFGKIHILTLLLLQFKLVAFYLLSLSHTADPSAILLKDQNTRQTLIHIAM